MHAKYNKEINDLRDLIGNKTSIPKDQVYPKFDTVAQIYNQIVDEKIVSLMRKSLLKILQKYKQTIKITLTAEHLKEVKNLIHEKSLRDEIKSDYFQSNPEVTRMLPNSTPEFMHIPLDYQGFCLFSLVENKGLLLSGKPSIGVFK